MSGTSLETYPIHLGLGAKATPQPEFPRDERAMQWYMDYGARHADDGAEGRIVAMYRFMEDWPSWEVHPNGEEVVVCVSGSIELVQELADGSHASTMLGPREYAINPAGNWHTANVSEEANCLFITPGMGTQNRPR